MKEILYKLLSEVKKDKDILAVALFGSYARNEEYRDIDVALVLKEKMSKKKMSKIKLKYISSNPKLDIQVFQQIPMYIRIRILKEGKFILSKDNDKLYDFAVQTMKEFEFYKKIYESYLQNVKTR